VVTVAAEIVTKLQDSLHWVDINLTLPELYQPGVTGAEWARAATSILVWVAVPLCVGAIRTSRREVM
jgi:ABC-2 type transport system permease protein